MSVTHKTVGYRTASLKQVPTCPRAEEKLVTPASAVSSVTSESTGRKVFTSVLECSLT